MTDLEKLLALTVDPVREFTLGYDPERFERWYVFGGGTYRGQGNTPGEALERLAGVVLKARADPEPNPESTERWK